MKTRRPLIVPLLLAALLTVLPEAILAGWRAGTGRVDITPDEPVWLAGYAARRAPSEGVAGPIQVKALALEDGEGRRLVAITCDLLTMPREVAEPVAARISARWALPRARILLAASHSHSAPVIRDRLIDMYFLDEERLRQVDRYTERVEEALFEAARQALDSLEPAEVRVGSGEAGFAENRRKVNPGDPVDHEVPVLLADFEKPGETSRAAEAGGARGGDGNGKTAENDATGTSNAPGRRAVLFAYACHNTTLSGPHVCGDYAGFAQEELESRNPGLLALFASGCGGDQNPLPRRTMELAKKYGRELAGAVEEVLSSPTELVEASSSAAMSWIDLPLVPPPGREEVEADLASTNRYVERRAERLLEKLDSGEGIPSSYPYAAQVWRLGDGLFVVALAGEVVVDYALRLKREVLEATATDGRVMVLAYANDGPGYIPSERVLEEGGYEGEGAMLYYQHHGPWAAGVEERVVSQVLGLARETLTAGAVLAEGAAIEKVWGEGSFTEGPAFGHDGRLYLSDIPNDRILALSRGNTFLFRRPSGKANGLIFDDQGRLIACEGADGGNRRVTRTERDGTITVLAGRFEGRRFNSPNDVTIDPEGRIYFSDPRYTGDEPREIEEEAVYRIDPSGEVHQVIADVARPNGLAVSPGGETLYVSDNGASKLYAYRISDAERLERDRLVFDFGGGRGIDGMEVDAEGNIYGAAGRGPLSGVWVITPGGTLLDFIPLPEVATNCSFADGGRTLYMTAGTSVYRVRVRWKGLGF